MPPSAATNQYPPVGRVAAMPDDRLVEPGAAHRAVEAGVAEGEDAAVGGHQPVPAAVGGGRHAHEGWLSGVPPVEP